MKAKHIAIAILLISISFAGFAQNVLTPPNVRILLQGRWASIQDSNYTWTVAGDNITEWKGRTTRPQTYDYTVEKESCDPNVDKKNGGKNFSGLYIDESSTYTGMEFCNMLITMTKDTLEILSVDGHTTFKKKP